MVYPTVLPCPRYTLCYPAYVHPAYPALLYTLLPWVHPAVLGTPSSSPGTSLEPGNLLPKAGRSESPTLCKSVQERAKVVQKSSCHRGTPRDVLGQE